MSGAAVTWRRGVVASNDEVSFKVPARQTGRVERDRDFRGACSRDGPRRRSGSQPIYRSGEPVDHLVPEELVVRLVDDVVHEKLLRRGEDSAKSNFAVRGDRIGVQISNQKSRRWANCQRGEWVVQIHAVDVLRRLVRVDKRGRARETVGSGVTNPAPQSREEGIDFVLRLVGLDEESAAGEHPLLEGLYFLRRPPRHVVRQPDDVVISEKLGGGLTRIHRYRRAARRHVGENR
jgi:hypothetical protein